MFACAQRWKASCQLKPTLVQTHNEIRFSTVHSQKVGIKLNFLCAFYCEAGELLLFFTFNFFGFGAAIQHKPTRILVCLTKVRKQLKGAWLTLRSRVVAMFPFYFGACFILLLCFSTLLLLLIYVKTRDG